MASDNPLISVENYEVFFVYSIQEHFPQIKISTLVGFETFQPPPTLLHQHLHFSLIFSYNILILSKELNYHARMLPA